MSALRPMPPRPSLEYEHKQAKALLRRLRAGNPESLARARERHPHIDVSAPERIRLADAQLIVAREYGFASWPRLVRWFGDVERQRHAPLELHGDRDQYDRRVSGLLSEHYADRDWARRAIAAYVPRFYGMSVDDVFDSVVTEDDARLAVARMQGAQSWDVLLERLAAPSATRPAAWDVDPMHRVKAAMEAGDLGALERIVAEFPALMHPSEHEMTSGWTLMTMALWQERTRGADAMRPIMQWLVEHDFDRQHALNVRLRGHMSMTPDEVRRLLEERADPNCVAPNGLTALEHALLRYWNGEAVDVLAAQATPRRALWIAAGLGDVDGVRSFLDRQHKPTPAARQNRPDFLAVGLPGMMPLPEASDEEILVEALIVAMLNGRTGVLEYLASHGAPLNSLVFGEPLINIAVGNGMQAAVECLVRCGANLDLRGHQSATSARELARERFEQRPEDAVIRSILELCGMDPDVILAGRDARPLPAPTIDSSLATALELASHDAAHLGQADVRPENLLVGLFRVGGPPLYIVKSDGRFDVERFHTDMADRLAPGQDHIDRPELPMHADAEAALKAAIALAMELRQESVNGLLLLHSLTRSDGGQVAELLARYGVSAAAVNELLTQSL
ncbi:MAG: Clp domain protein [Gemmatimonadetes bacterium]|nr:Clp domain protein [Gemmatimonadota bacterium]